MDVSISVMDRLPTAKVLSQDEKYRKVFVIAQKLATIASYISICCEFSRDDYKSLGSRPTCNC